MALIPRGLSVRPALCDPVPLGLAQRSRTSAQRSRPRQAWAISSAASLFAWRGLRCRKDRLPRASTIQIEPATDADVRPAAEVAVRSLRWTKGWLDQPKFKDEDYALLAGREVQAYRKLYLTATPYPSTLLVARLRQTEAPKEETNSWFDFGGSGSTSSKVVGCVGCEVKCFNIFTNEELPVFRSDGGRETVLRPVMADLAVSSECQGRGIGRKLVEKLEEAVREEWGYDELVLLVEATNFQARGVYERLGYRLAGIRLGQVTTYLDASEPRDSTSRVKERTTVAFLLRKSLKPFPWGTLENQNWGLLLALLGGAAYLQSSDGEELLGLPLEELFRYASDAGLAVPFPSFPV
ncbi:CDC123 [Symbiodinium necroappetens]|uniref:CDC123 protein n=1 Tax=Symbiodinium necroappetens TaxID=1628268 RepID=A0A812QZS8_9DINO|nr:CDC123 [Symbiodinium necroappetens]